MITAVQCIYAFQNTHTIRCFLLDITIRSAPLMTINRTRTTTKTEMPSVFMAKRSYDDINIE